MLLPTVAKRRFGFLGCFGLFLTVAVSIEWLELPLRAWIVAKALPLMTFIVTKSEKYIQNTRDSLFGLYWLRGGSAVGVCSVLLILGTPVVLFINGSFLVQRLTLAPSEMLTLDPAFILAPVLARRALALGVERQDQNKLVLTAYALAYALCVNTMDDLVGDQNFMLLMQVLMALEVYWLDYVI
jgi:hypothetical protein